jgi:hypothetical protein
MIHKEREYEQNEKKVQKAQTLLLKEGFSNQPVNRFNNKKTTGSIFLKNKNFRKWNKD